jgi:NtrC-family two-component system sensor histidine kinase KinB
MIGPRQKLSLGFGGLLLIILIIGIQSIIHFTKLGESIDVILRENYRSVIACQQMKEALERMDSGILFELLGYTQKGYELIRKNELVFEMALQVELNNITLPGEGEKANHLKSLFSQYRTVLEKVEDSKSPINVRRSTYFTDLFPLFLQIKDMAGEILRMNQQNMSDANDLARNRATSARKQMYILLFIGAIIAIGFIFFAGRWIFRSPA